MSLLPGFANKPGFHFDLWSGCRYSFTSVVEELSMLNVEAISPVSMIRNFVVDYEQQWADGHTTRGTTVFEALQKDMAAILFYWNVPNPAGVVRQEIVSIKPE
jgi:hypothetical protein